MADQKSNNANQYAHSMIFQLASQTAEKCKEQETIKKSTGVTEQFTNTCGHSGKYRDSNEAKNQIKGNAERSVLFTEAVAAQCNGKRLQRDRNS